MTLRATLTRALPVSALLVLAAVTTAAAADPEPVFDLTDDHGHHVTEQDFRGKLTIVVFGYTNCPDVCPTTLQDLSTALGYLDTSRIAIAFVSIDWRNDTSERLADYVSRFSPVTVGLTGTEDQLRAAAKSFGADFVDVPDPDRPGRTVVAHSAHRHLLSPDGRYLGDLPDHATPMQIARRLFRILKGPLAQSSKRGPG